MIAPAAERPLGAPSASTARSWAWLGAWGWPVLVLALAAAPRLLRLDAMEFKADEAAVALAARRIVEAGQWPHAGIGMSVGPANAPLFEYLMALPLALTSDARAAVAAIALANALAALLTYLLARRLWGTLAGATAGLLFALAPWPAAFERKIWAPDLEPLFGTVCLCLLLGAGAPGPWRLALAVAAWLWMAQLHPFALLLAPVLIAVGVVARRQLRIGPLLAGLALGLTPLAPYFAYEWDHGWQDALVLLQAVSRPSTLDGMALTAALSLLAGLGLPDLGSLPLDHLGLPAPLFQALSTIAVLALAGAGLIATFVVVRGHRRDASRARRRLAGQLLLLLSWSVVPVLVALRHSVPVYPHYLLSTLPAPFLLLGFGAAWAAGRLRGGAALVAPLAAARTAAVILVVAALVAGWGLVLGRYIAALPPRPFVWDYSVPYGDSAQIAALGRSAAAGGALWQDVDPVIQPMLNYGLRDVPRQDLPPAMLVIPPAGHAAGYLLDDNKAAPLAQALLNAGAQTIGRVVYMDSLHHVAVLRWEATANPDALAAGLRPLPVQLANGVRFLGYRATVASGALTVEYVWRAMRADQAVTTGDLALYTHVLDERGQTRAQVDTMPYPSARWQAGETMALFVTVPLKGLPPGQYTIRAGMYRRPSIARVPALDAQGKQEDGEFALGTITLGP